MQNLWIFQLKQAFSAEQKATLQSSLNQLMQQWQSHGKDVPGRYEFRHGRFLIVQAPVGANSGCSIDSMTQAVEAMLKTAGLDILPNNNICYLDADRTVKSVDFRDVKAMVEAGGLTSASIIFDATMGQDSDLSKWEVELADSWLSRYLVAGKPA